MRTWPRILGLAFLAVALGGCGAVDMTRDLPGSDQRKLERGAARAEVEQALGAPLRVWQPNGEVAYGLYRVRDAVKGSTGEALGFATVDVITLGLTEIIYATGKDVPPGQTDSTWRPRPFRLAWIGFDQQGRVFGRYREFDVLPEHPPAPSER